MRRAICITLALVAIAVACNGYSLRRTDLGLEPESMGAQPAPWSSVAWVAPDQIVLGRAPLIAQENSSAELWTFAPSSTHEERIAIEGSSCPEADFVNPQVLEGGFIGLLAWCLPLTDGVSELLTYDLATGRTALLVRPDDVPRDYAWSPAMDRAVVWGGGLICGGLAWLSEAGTENFDVTVSDGTEEFVISDAYAMRSGDCGETGRASSPTWSPDGETISFFGSPASVGVAGSARLVVPWGLYAMGPEDDVAKLILDHLIDPRGPCWSPDSQWLAFTGRVGDTAGTWAVSFGESHLVRLTAVELESCEWSPDGRSIAGLAPTGGSVPSETSDLQQIDVRALHDL